jgi:hypothetical protein
MSVLQEVWPHRCAAVGQFERPAARLRPGVAAPHSHTAQVAAAVREAGMGRAQRAVQGEQLPLYHIQSITLLINHITYNSVGFQTNLDV